MFSIIGNVYRFLTSADSKQKYQKELEDALDKLDQEIEKENELQLPANKTKVKEEDYSDKNCFRRTGRITTVDSNHIIIDKTLLFDIEKCRHLGDMKVGYNVQYLAYKSKNEYIKIVKILQILNEYWDENLTDQQLNSDLQDLKESEPEYFSSHQRSILGLIINRYDNFITVDTDYSKLEVDLDTVSLEYTPQLGDRVYLSCNVQTDESFVDNAGEILEVKSIHPARSKTIITEILEVRETYGIIGGDCLFTLDILGSGYKPSAGDTVSADMVECERDKYHWRCTKITPLEIATTKTTTVSARPTDTPLLLNKNGIVVGDGLKFKFDNLYDHEEKELIIRNEGDTVQKVLRCALMVKKSQSQLRLLKPGMKDYFLINPGETKSYHFQAKAQFYGSSTEMFVITFAAGFKIGRKIEIEVGGNVENKDNKDSKEGVRNYRRNGFYANQVWSKKYEIIPGVSVSTKPRFLSVSIGTFEVPERLRNILLSTQNFEDIKGDLEGAFQSLNGEINFNNYIHRFQTLLHIEEIECFINIRQYDQERAHFTKEDEYLALEIENLAERRPSLVLGDSLKARNPWAEANDNRVYEGFIHKIFYNRILLKFNAGFHAKYNGEDYSLEFFFSRSSFRKQHYAVRKAHNFGPNFLFPTKISLHKCLQLNANLNENYDLAIGEKLENIKWFNENLNTVQKIAVKNVLRGEARPMPYIIFGPPGTGKTMTVVEIILQLATQLKNSRLLIATPSNSSADLIATRLIGCKALKPGDFIRLVSHNLVEKDLIPNHLKPYCATADISADNTSKDSMLVTESGLKLKCQIKHLGRHRITIGTCITLGTLMQMGFPRGHFTHTIIDEAGQCLEPESLIPLTQIDPVCGQIILAGDPMQLGPIVLQRYAGNKGLGTSLLERLLNCTPYKKDRERFHETGYDSRLVTKLIYNYRSLPTILRVYNDLFYDSELKPMVNDEDSEELNLLKSLSDILPQSDTRPENHGLFFNGIRGENYQSSDSPSWFNSAEAKSVMSFVIKLYKKHINPKNIGIITPYQRQVKTIRNLFNEMEIILPKIGSVEEFQGQERDIIIISTVRSTKSLIPNDLRHALGFVQSKKRMNVAISRARVLLVIFGNPHLLAMDPCWRHLIKYCVDNDAYAGCDLPASVLDD